MKAKQQASILYKQQQQHSPWLFAHNNVAKIGSICWYHMTHKNPAVVKKTTTVIMINIT